MKVRKAPATIKKINPAVFSRFNNSKTDRMWYKTLVFTEREEIRTAIMKRVGAWLCAGQLRIENYL